MRAEPKTVAPGRPMASTAAKPAAISAPIACACAWGLSSSRSRRSRSACSLIPRTLQPMLRHVADPHAENEHHRSAEVERKHERRARVALEPHELVRAPHPAAVENADREQVEEVEQEPDVGERGQQV